MENFFFIIQLKLRFILIWIKKFNLILGLNSLEELMYDD